MSQTKEAKRAAAEARQIEYDKLTLEQKLERALVYGDYTKQVSKLKKKIEREQKKERVAPKNRKPNVKPKTKEK